MRAGVGPPSFWYLRPVGRRAPGRGPPDEPARSAFRRPRSVIAGDHDRGLVGELPDRGARRDQPSAPCRVQTQMLVEVVIVQPGDRGLEDVGGRDRPRRDPPPAAVEQERGLGLGAGQAELPGERPAQPRRRVLAQLAQALGDLVLGQPRHLAGASEHALELVRRGEPHRPGAVLADRRRQQRERRGGRHVEVAPPSAKHLRRCRAAGPTTTGLIC